MAENAKKELQERIGSIVSKLSELSEVDLATIDGMTYGMVLKSDQAKNHYGQKTA